MNQNGCSLSIRTTVHFRHNAHTQSISGKIEALEYLNSEGGLFCFKTCKPNSGKPDNAIETKCKIAWKPQANLTGINLSCSRNAGDKCRKNDPYAKLVRVRLCGAILSGAQFEYTNLVEANFTGADLNDANFQDAHMGKVILTDTQLTNADFTNAKLQKANFENANLFEAKFRSARLFKANFRGTNLSDARFNNAKLRKTNFENAVLCGTRLKGASNLEQDQLSDACGNDSTVLPEGLTIEKCSKKFEEKFKNLCFKGITPVTKHDYAILTCCKS